MSIAKPTMSKSEKALPVVYSLNFNCNSLRNNTIECDSLGIHYDLTEDGRVRYIRRWHRDTNTYMPVGQIRFHHFKRDELRIGNDDAPWSLAKDFVRREGGMILSR